MITVDYSPMKDFTTHEAFTAMLGRLEAAHSDLMNGSGRGSDFLGWRDLPRDYDKDEFARVKAAAAKIQKDCQVLLVVGIGGSYLGARAVIECLTSPFYNLKSKETPEIYFVGNNLSAAYLQDILGIIGDRDVCLNVISKSGTTTEPSVAFRVFRAWLEKKYGREEARRRIYATTDKARGALKSLSNTEGYETFVIPDDVGGRFSVLTPVGLLPIAVAGIDIDALMSGAAEAMELCAKPGGENPAWQYAAARNCLYEAGKTCEVLACYEPSFRFMTEWWKQLYGESEGKEGKGILPHSLELTADLHSMGQYMQEGLRNLMETVVAFDTPSVTLALPEDPEDLDGLNFLTGRDLNDINTQARLGTLLAHVDGGVPNIVLHVTKNDAKNLGQLIYMFEFACGLSGYLLGVNPFDQPGVEAYKRNMFALLGKPGYEEMRKDLLARLK